MPCNCEIDPERGPVKVRAWGVLTPAEVMATRSKFTTHPAFSSDWSQLYDLREVTNVSANGSEVQGVADTSVFGPGSRRAFVAPRDETFGLSRMFATYREIAGGKELIEVFRSIEDAEKWLGLGVS
jgi:hypothetical protein